MITRQHKIQQEKEATPMKNNRWWGIVAATLFYLVTSTAQSSTYYFHTDHLGTPQVLTDENQSVVWKGEYDPFGEATETVDSVEQNLRFPGQYLDRESGLHYNYFRTYDSSLGRYIQSDPRGILLDFSNPQRQMAAMMGVPISVNDRLGYLNHNYNYVDANPVMGTDPTGENTLVGTGWGFTVGGPPGAVVGAIIGTSIGVGAYLMCTSDDEPEPDRKNCEALKQSILNTCYGLKGRKRMACFEAANTSYRQCMGYE